VYEYEVVVDTRSNIWEVLVEGYPGNECEGLGPVISEFRMLNFDTPTG